MEREIPITIRDKIATAPRDALYVCGNSDYTINFKFDEEWEGFNEKTARFVFNGQHQEVIFTGNRCPVPILSDIYFFEVGVYAGNLSTTTKAYVPASKSVLCGETSPTQPVRVLVPASELEKKADKEYVDAKIEQSGKGEGTPIYIQPDVPVNAPEGAVWIDEDERSPELYVQDYEPTDAPDGSVWIKPNPTEETPESGGVTRGEMEACVKQCVEDMFASIEIAEEGAY